MKKQRISIRNLRDLKFIFENNLLSEIDKVFNILSFNNGKIYLYFFKSINELIEELGVKLPEWVKGVTIDNKIFLIEYNNHYYESYKCFEKVVVHEVIHAVMNCKGIDGLPQWMNEGIAMYLAKQGEDVNLEKFVGYSNNTVYPNEDFFYEKSYILTKNIIDSYGIDCFLSHLLNFTDELKKYTVLRS